MAYDLLTRNGHSLLTMASLLQKAIRREDVNRAGYACNELWEKYPDYLWKRLLVISAEDCYGIMTQEIMALRDAEKIVNKGKTKKTRIFFAKAVVLLVYARKNRDADYMANYKFNNHFELDESDLIDFDQYDNDHTVPEYVFDVHTIEGKRSGKTKEQFFVEEEQALKPKQQSIFDLTEPWAQTKK